MRNKFFDLVLNDNIKHYSENQINDITYNLQSKNYQNLIKNISLNFDNIVKKRVENIKRISLNQDKITLITNALFDSNFRKQRHFGPTKKNVREKIEHGLKLKKPLIFIGLMFTRKNVCLLKTGTNKENAVDLAEVISLANLNAWMKVIDYFYPFGVKYLILSEGRRFIDAFDLCLPLVKSYQIKLKKLIKDLGLNYLELDDFEEFIEKKLSNKDKTKRMKCYLEALQTYKKNVGPNLPWHKIDDHLIKAIKNDPIKDKRNPANNFVPLWKSIIHSLPYAFVVDYCYKNSYPCSDFYREMFQYIFKNQKSKFRITREICEQVLNYSWNKAIYHNARVLGDNLANILPEKLIDYGITFRTSINPKPGDHLGIFAIRETTSRVQPWHGKIFFYKKGEKNKYTCLTRLEIEGRYQGIPVRKDSYIQFYIDKNLNHYFQNTNASIGSDFDMSNL